MDIQALPKTVIDNWLNSNVHSPVHIASAHDKPLLSVVSHISVVGSYQEEVAWRRCHGLNQDNGFDNWQPALIGDYQ